MHYLYLAIAIIAEVIATSALKASDGFTKVLPSSLAIVGFGIAFYCLSLIVKTMPLGIVYAIWSGMGIVLVSVVGYFLFNQKLDVPAILGIALIVSGVIVLNLFSKSLAH